MINLAQKIFICRRCYFAPSLILLLSLITSAATADDVLEATGNVQAFFNYDIFAEGDSVGDVEVKIRVTPQDGYQISESTSVQATGTWGEIDLKSTSKEEYSHQNGLIEADNKTYNHKQVYWTKISSSGEELWINFSEIENQQQKQEAELVGFSFGLLNSFIPAAGEVLAVSQLLFSDTTNGPVNIRFPKSAYDTTWLHLPKFWSLQQHKLPAEVGLLDMQTISIVQLDVEHKGTQVEMLNGVDISTDHYTLSAKDRAPLEIWLAINENNIAYYFMIKGEDEDGPFTIRLAQNEVGNSELSQRNGD